MALDGGSKQTRRRLWFSALFFSGTVIAVLGWMADFGKYPEKFQVAALIGHFIQLIAVFGLLVMPDGEHVEGESKDDEF